MLHTAMVGQLARILAGFFALGIPRAGVNFY